MTSTDSAKSADAFYAEYDNWKGWSRLFSYTADQAVYYAGELRDVQLANADVLEIGYGDGGLLAWARDRGARISGVEIIPVLIEAAKARGVELLSPEFEKNAVSYKGRFDTIIAFDVFEHFSLTNVVARLRGAQMMLKDNGHLILRFPNAQSPFGLAPQNGDPTHISALSRSTLELLLQGTSFEVVRYGPAFRIGGGSIPKRMVRALRYLSRDIISSLLNFVYSLNIPWDPVVVIVLRNAAQKDALKGVSQ